MEANTAFDLANVKAIVWYLTEYAERVHFVLEERIYALLLKYLPGFGRDIYDLSEDHEEIARDFTFFTESAAKLETNEPGAERAFIERARDYIANERGHIIAEEELFFPYAKEYLNADQWSKLEDAAQSVRFDQIEAAPHGPVLRKLCRNRWTGRSRFIVSSGQTLQAPRDCELGSFA